MWRNCRLCRGGALRGSRLGRLAVPIFGEGWRGTVPDCAARWRLTTWLLVWTPAKLPIVPRLRIAERFQTAPLRSGLPPGGDSPRLEGGCLMGRLIVSAVVRSAVQRMIVSGRYRASREVWCAVNGAGVLGLWVAAWVNQSRWGLRILCSSDCISATRWGSVGARFWVSPGSD